MVETIGYITIVVVLCVVLLAGVPAAFNSLFPQKRNQPRLAGTAIPQIGEGFDITKRYDIVYSCGDYGGSVVERLHGIRIIGYVGKSDDESVGKMFMRSRRPVVEFVDGRRAYLMPQAIVSLQETAGE